MDNEIDLRFTMPLEVRPDDDGYIAGCPPLDVFSQGTTDEEAVANLREALHLFLVSCFDRDSLVPVLKDCGLEPVSGEATPINRSLEVAISLRHKGGHAVPDGSVIDSQHER